MAFDLDKIVDAQKARKPYEFTFDGETYQLPGRMDVRALAAVLAGRLDEGFGILFGVEQWAKLQASTKLLDRDGLKALWDDYLGYTDGVSLGEVSASSGSSTSTARRSKPTSNGSTKSTSRLSSVD